METPEEIRERLREEVCPEHPPSFDLDEHLLGIAVEVARVRESHDRVRTAAARRMARDSVRGIS